MTWLLRSIRLLALVAWVGGLAFFVSAVTVVAFRGLPNTHEAGIVVRGSLLAIHRIGLVAGLVYLLATLTLIATQRDGHLARAAEILLVTLMLGLTAFLHFSVIPRMEKDRLSLGGDVTAAPSGAPAAVSFEHLHQLSVKLESTVLLAGIALILLAPVRQREHRAD